MNLFVRRKPKMDKNLEPFYHFAQFVIFLNPIPLTFESEAKATENIHTAARNHISCWGV